MSRGTLVIYLSDGYLFMHERVSRYMSSVFATDLCILLFGVVCFIDGVSGKEQTT